MIYLIIIIIVFITLNHLLNSSLNRHFNSSYDKQKLHTYMSKCNYEKALIYGMRYLKKKSEDYFFNNQVAYCLIKLQRFNEAIKHLETAILSQPKEDNAS